LGMKQTGWLLIPRRGDSGLSRGSFCCLKIWQAGWTLVDARKESIGLNPQPEENIVGSRQK